MEHLINMIISSDLLTAKKWHLSETILKESKILEVKKAIGNKRWPRTMVKDSSESLSQM